jgi:hypothetical protein
MSLPWINDFRMSSDLWPFLRLSASTRDHADERHSHEPAPTCTSAQDGAKTPIGIGGADLGLTVDPAGSVFVTASGPNVVDKITRAPHAPVARSSSEELLAEHLASAHRLDLTFGRSHLVLGLAAALAGRVACRLDRTGYRSREDQFQRMGEQPAGVSEQRQTYWKQDDRHAEDDGEQAEQQRHDPEQSAGKASKETHS